MKKLFFVVNVDWFFLSHRLPLALAAIERGWEVFLLTSNTGRKNEIENYGIKFIDIPFERSGTNWKHDLKCVRMLVTYYRRYQPDIIHNVTLKAALLGSIAAKLSRSRKVVNAISGLGYNFTDGRDGLLQKLIRKLMNFAFKSDYFYFILQNPDDIQMMKKLNFVPDSHYKLIKGSGIDLNEFPFTPSQNKEKLKILFPARILYDKGVMEFIGAAKLLEKEWKDKVKFVLAGDCDEHNKAVVKQADLEKHLIQDYLEWVGFQNNMLPLYQASDIVVLPSYREGLPKSLIEACAVGRPIITTDVPGCRECVVDGYNGRIVPVKAVEPLASAISELCENSEKRTKMGRNSRVLAEREFSIENVIEKTFDIYGEILNKDTK